MDSKDVIALIISIVALLVSIGTFFYNKKIHTKEELAKAIKNYIYDFYFRGELSQTIKLPGNQTAKSIDDARRILKDKIDRDDWGKKTNAAGGVETYKRIAEEFAKNLEFIGLLVFSGLLPLKILLPYICGVVIRDWVICRDWIISVNEQENATKFRQTGLVFNRRHAIWLTMITLKWAYDNLDNKNTREYIKDFGGLEKLKETVKKINKQDRDLMPIDVKCYVMKIINK